MNRKYEILLSHSGVDKHARGLDYDAVYDVYIVADVSEKLFGSNFRVVDDVFLNASQ